jgi:hypothetical protein
VIEAVGTGTVFLLLNLALGITVLLSARYLLERFVPLYTLDDVTIIVLSFIQGLAFDSWRRP